MFFKNFKLKIEFLWVVVVFCYKELRLIFFFLVRMLDVEKCGVEDISLKNRNGKCE